MQLFFIRPNTVMLIRLCFPASLSSHYNNAYSPLKPLCWLLKCGPVFIVAFRLYVLVCVPPVGSTCCSYAGRHTTCREYCQAIFRTDSTPTVSQINAVKEYCQSHSTQLLNCVSNFTKSYPIRSPIDSKCVCCRTSVCSLLTHRAPAHVCSFCSKLVFLHNPG